jgi:hypothetical protein
VDDNQTQGLWHGNEISAGEWVYPVPNGSALSGLGYLGGWRFPGFHPGLGWGAPLELRNKFGMLESDG